MTWYLWLLLIGVYGFMVALILAGANIMDDEGGEEK